MSYSLTNCIPTEIKFYECLHEIENTCLKQIKRILFSPRLILIHHTDIVLLHLRSDFEKVPV
jgi:hypothetical protein